jgi:hypothetical protein
MAGPIIKTPRGTVAVGKNGKAELTWNTNFQPKWQKRYSEAQKWVDNEVLMQCEPFTPLRTGMLVKSSILGTEPGSGLVQWIAPYARRQYYSKRKPGSASGPLRGPYWFERAKAIYKQHWIDGVRRIAGGGQA